MNMDFNDAGSQMGDLIPANTLCRLNMFIRPGGYGEGGILTQSKTSDAMMLDVEYTVVNGPFARRKFWAFIVISGGKLDDRGQSKAGNISRATLRAILESSRGILPHDTSPAAQAKRKIASYGEFNGMEFAAKIGIEQDKSGQYSDKNKLQVVITPDKKEYPDIMAGNVISQPVPQGSLQTGQAPAWQQAPRQHQQPQPAWLPSQGSPANEQPKETIPDPANNNGGGVPIPKWAE